MADAPGRILDRLAFTSDEAAQSLGVSRSFFYTHILADVRVVRSAAWSATNRQKSVVPGSVEDLDRVAGRVVGEDLFDRRVR